MHVIVAGGTGFIGSALCEALKERGDRVTVLSRKGGPGRITWEEPLPECDAVINLCGEGILNRRWTPQFKKKIADSRIGATRKLVEKMGGRGYLINASAVGYYGEGFLADVCERWEAAAARAERWAAIRIGIVLGQGGSFGAMRRMFGLGLGGKVGSGRQGFSWIHLEDLVQLFLFVLDGRFEGVFEGTAPDPVTNGEFTEKLAKRLRRPAFLGIPGWALRLMLGEGAEALLNGALVYPERALQEGFQFRYGTLERALEELCDG
ncbi:MAG: TIGR01777 family oxidoreductase [Parachlamydiales bacterium]